MSESKNKSILLDGEDTFPDFGNQKWVAAMQKKYSQDKEPSEFSARARKKKRIYKRKKTQ
jgi:hypothetical protein